MIRNSAKVSNFCADVIGDICGVLSGAISALIAMKMAERFTMNFNIQFILSAIVAALTVGGKAFGAPEYLRFSYATSDENIVEAMRRIKETLARLK